MYECAFLLGLVSLLGHDDFRVRRDATVILEQTNLILEGQLRLCRSTDPQVNYYIKTTLCRIWVGRGRKHLKDNKYTIWPQLDMHHDWHARCLSRFLNNNMRPDHPWYSNYRKATELYIFERIVNGDDPAIFLKPLLLQMWRIEINWYWTYHIRPLLSKPQPHMPWAGD